MIVNLYKLHDTTSLWPLSLLMKSEKQRKSLFVYVGMLGLFSLCTKIKQRIRLYQLAESVFLGNDGDCTCYLGVLRSGKTSSHLLIICPPDSERTMNFHPLVETKAQLQNRILEEAGSCWVLLASCLPRYDFFQIIRGINLAFLRDIVQGKMECLIFLDFWFLKYVTTIMNLQNR